MKFSIFSLSSAIAYATSLFFGLDTFVKTFEKHRDGDPTDFLRQALISVGEYQPWALKWFLLLYFLFIGFRFYAHAEAIDGNKVFTGTYENGFGKWLRLCWVFPALLLPIWMAFKPVDDGDSASSLLSIVSLSLFVMYSGMAIWSYLFLDNWVTNRRETLLTAEKRTLMQILDSALVFLILLLIAFSFSKLHGVSCMLMFIVLASCSFVVSLQVVVFYGSHERFGLFAWATGILMAVLMLQNCVVFIMFLPGSNAPFFPLGTQ